MTSPSSTLTDLSLPLSSDPSLISSLSGSTRPGPATRNGPGAAGGVDAASACSLGRERPKITVTNSVKANRTATTIHNFLDITLLQIHEIQFRVRPDSNPPLSHSCA